MASIKELSMILESTPVDQAIMLTANHGVGKSEFIRDYFTERGYSVVTLFLGQMADAGDLIGLPERVDIEVTNSIGETVKQKITEFCPPKWWRFDNEEKLIIFMDEFNRGKPEVYQCVFDMVLNRKLNGHDLPRHTRIIAATNPIDSEFDYEVRELDSALLDRFNCYDFTPSVEDWIDWAVKHGVHRSVIGFINKNRQYLDPTGKEKGTTILPSRRSWKRVSDIINKDKTILENEERFKLMFMGVVGIGATAKFYDYVLHDANQVSALNVINMKTGDTSVLEKVKRMSNQECIALNKEIAMYMDENYEVLYESSDSNRYCSNLNLYLNTINNEVKAEFFSNHLKQHSKWAPEFLKRNPKLSTDFLRTLNGKSKEEKAFEAHMKGEDVGGETDRDDSGEEWKRDMGDDDLSREIDDLTK